MGCSLRVLGVGWGERDLVEVYLMNVMENNNHMFRAVLAIIRLSMELKG